MNSPVLISGTREAGRLLAQSLAYTQVGKLGESSVTCCFVLGRVFRCRTSNKSN